MQALHLHVSDRIWKCLSCLSAAHIPAGLLIRPERMIGVELEFVCGVRRDLDLAGLRAKPRDDVADWTALELRDHQCSVCICLFAATCRVYEFTPLGQPLDDRTGTCATQISAPGQRMTEAKLRSL